MCQLWTPTRYELQTFVAHPAAFVQHDTFHLGAIAIPGLTTKSTENGLKCLVTDYMLT